MPSGKGDAVRILVTSDIHGNRVLVHRLLNIAEKLSVDALVLAGDITSKGLYRLKRHGSRYDLLQCRLPMG